MLKFQSMLCLAMLAASAAGAQEIDCDTAQVQLELTFCAERDWKIADADLNAAYKAAQKLMASIDAELPKAEQGAASSLRDAQRAWVTFRDAACNAEGFTWHGGSGEPMIVYGCRAMLTRERAAGLWTLVQSE